MFTAASVDMVHYNETVTRSTNDNNTTTIADTICHKHKNLPINLDLVCNLDRSDKHLLAPTPYCGPMFPVYTIHFNDIAHNGIAKWEYTSEQARDVDFNKLITQL